MAYCCKTSSGPHYILSFPSVFRVQGYHSTSVLLSRSTALVVQPSNSAKNNLQGTRGRSCARIMAAGERPRHTSSSLKQEGAFVLPHCTQYFVSHLAAVAEKEESSAQIIDGKATAAAIKEELKTKVEQLKERYGKVKFKSLYRQFHARVLSRSVCKKARCAGPWTSCRTCREQRRLGDICEEQEKGLRRGRHQVFRS